MGVVRVYREGSAWSLTGKRALGTYAFDDIPLALKEKLAVLLVTQKGFRDERVGRKINDDTYWIFTGAD